MTLIRNELMSRHCSLRVGGVVDCYYTPESVQALVDYLRCYDGEVLWFGLGSNILVSDAGLRGTVINPLVGLKKMDQLDSVRVKAQAGVTNAALIRYCAAVDLGGFEFLATIPGTVGGALAMNAGAYGSETWDFVEQVETINREGVIHQRTKDEFCIGYRQSGIAENEWFLSATFVLSSIPKQRIDEKTKSYITQRAETQPTGKASCGSVFRNPDDLFAGQLIEQVNLKGVCEGAACVSEKHGNFIVNTGGATASDIQALIELVQQTVLAKKKVRLETEVQLIGMERL